MDPAAGDQSSIEYTAPVKLRQPHASTARPRAPTVPASAARASPGPRSPCSSRSSTRRPALPRSGAEAASSQNATPVIATVSANVYSGRSSARGRPGSCPRAWGEPRSPARAPTRSCHLRRCGSARRCTRDRSRSPRAVGERIEREPERVAVAEGPHSDPNGFDDGTEPSGFMPQDLAAELVEQRLGRARILAAVADHDEERASGPNAMRPPLWLDRPPIGDSSNTVRPTAWPSRIRSRITWLRSALARGRPRDVDVDERHAAATRGAAPRRGLLVRRRCSRRRSVPMSVPSGAGIEDAQVPEARSR